jgi:hypothetical protein
MIKPLPMQIEHSAARARASEGYGFQIGNTNLFVGPGPRGTRAPVVLAYFRPGMKKPQSVAEFPSSSAAEKFIAALKDGIDEGTGRIGGSDD